MRIKLPVQLIPILLHPGHDQAYLSAEKDCREHTFTRVSAKTWVLLCSGQCQIQGQSLRDSPQHHESIECGFAQNVWRSLLPDELFRLLDFCRLLGPPHPKTQTLMPKNLRQGTYSPQTVQEISLLRNPQQRKTARNLLAHAKIIQSLPLHWPGIKRTLILCQNHLSLCKQYLPQVQGVHLQVWIRQIRK